MFFAHNELLDNDFGVFFFAQSNMKSRVHLCFGFQIKRHAAAMVSVYGLEHHGQTNVLRHRPCLFGSGDRTTFGYWHTTLGEQPLGQVFVAGDVLCNGAGFVSLGSPNSPLTRAVTQLHQVTRG